MSRYDLMVGGGADDFNLARLIEVGQQRKCGILPILHRVDREPGVSWAPGSNHLSVDGENVSARAQFLRYDVFTQSSDPGASLDRGMGWYASMLGWGMSNPAVRLFNRDIHHQAGLKPHTLAMAQECGLQIPRTLVSNVLSDISGFSGPAIAKPVAGGTYTRTTDKALAEAQIDDGLMPMPALIQTQLAYPEYRTFVIGRELHVFRLTSRYVDYRPAGDNAMEYIGSDFPCGETVAALFALLDRFECEYCACDFKSDPETAAPVFLELNNGPMFAAFDACADGALCGAMIDHLLS